MLCIFLRRRLKEEEEEEKHTVSIFPRQAVQWECSLRSPVFTLRHISDEQQAIEIRVVNSV